MRIEDALFWEGFTYRERRRVRSCTDLTTQGCDGVISFIRERTGNLNVPSDCRNPHTTQPPN
jgi:hypothetical protein